MNIFNKQWILSEGFIEQEEEDGNLVFSKELENSIFWIYLPTYFPDVKCQYLSLWWKNTSLKITTELEYKTFYNFVKISDVQLPRNGPIDIKKSILGFVDILNKRYKISDTKLNIIDYHTITFETIDIKLYEKDSKSFVWYSIDNINFEWKEVINFKDIGFVFTPIDEIEILKLKLINYEIKKPNKEFENNKLFENCFIGIFNDLEIYNNSRYLFSINNIQKIGTVIYRTEVAQFSIIDENTNLKYSISAVQFLNKIE